MTDQRQDAGPTADPPSSQLPPPPQVAAGFALAITNLTKIAGLVVAVNEALLRTDLRPVALGIAAFMMAGAQGVETFLDKLLGR